MNDRTAANREKWADERRGYENKLVTEGECMGVLIIKHIDGSLFKGVHPERGDVYLSQKSKEEIMGGGIVKGGFIWWVD